MRAERRLGEPIAAQKETVGLNAGARGIGKSGVPPKHPTLSDAGIDKKLSSRAQKLAAVPEDRFEGMLGEWRAPNRLTFLGKRRTPTLCGNYINMTFLTPRYRRAPNKRTAGVVRRTPTALTINRPAGGAANGYIFT